MNFYKIIVSNYCDKNVIKGSNFPLTETQVNDVICLIRKHNSIIKNNPSIKYHSNGVAVKGISVYYNIPILEALLVYKTIKKCLYELENY